MSLLRASGLRHEEMIKEAVLGLLANVGKVVVKNPLRSLGVAFDASQIAGAPKQFNRMALAGKNLMEDIAARVPPGSM